MNYANNKRATNDIYNSFTIYCRGNIDGSFAVTEITCDDWYMKMDRETECECGLEFLDDTYAHVNIKDRISCSFDITNEQMTIKYLTDYGYKYQCIKE